MSRIFNFPIEIELFRVVKNVEDLEAKINHQNLQNLDLHQIKYTYRIKLQGKFLAASCRECGQRLKYKEVDGYYILSRYKTLHVHDGVEKTERVQKQLRREQPKLPQASLAMSLTRHPFSGKKQEDSNSVGKANLSSQHSTKMQPRFVDLITELSQKKYQIHIDKYYSGNQEINQRSQFLLLASPQMKTQFKRYGRCLFIYGIQHLCRENPNFPRDIQIKEKNKILRIKKRTRNYCLVILFGLNSFRKIVIFGFAIVLDESYETMSKIFKKFFQFNDCAQTETIITDRGEGVKKAVAQYHFKHLIDPEYLFNRFQQSKREALHQVISAETNKEYNQTLDIFKDTLSLEQKKQIEDFQQKSHLFCLSKIPKTFINLGKYTRFPFSILRKMIVEQSNIYTAKTYIDFVKRVCLMFSQANASSEKAEVFDQPCFKTRGFSFLKHCCENLAKEVMKQILHQVGRSTDWKIINYSSQIHCQYTLKQNESQEQISVFLENESKLRCTCGYKEKTGLPCDHIIKVAHQNKIELYEQVDQFFKQDAHNLNTIRLEDQYNQKTSCSENCDYE